MLCIKVSPTDGGRWHAAATTEDGRGIGVGSQCQATPEAAIGCLVRSHPGLFGLMDVSVASRSGSATPPGDDRFST